MEAGYTQLALSTQEFYDLLDEVLLDLIAEKEAILQELERFSHQLKQRAQQPLEQLIEQDNVLRLLCLSKAHRLLAETRRLSYDKQLETYIYGNFSPEEIDLLNKLHHLEIRTSKSIRQLCQEYLDTAAERNFQIFFDDGLLLQLPFNQAFFYAIVAGLKMYIIKHRRCPHVIQFKSELKAMPNINHPNAIIVFIRDIGRLHQKSFYHNAPEHHCDFSSRTLQLFSSLRDAHQKSEFIQWFFDFEQIFSPHLEQFQPPFTYHNKKIITPGYCQPVTQLSLNEDDRGIKITLQENMIFVKFKSTDNDAACYVKFMKLIHQEAIKRNIGRPELSDPCQEDGFLVFSIQLTTEQDAKILYDYLQNHQQTQASDLSDTVLATFQ